MNEKLPGLLRNPLLIVSAVAGVAVTGVVKYDKLSIKDEKTLTEQSVNDVLSSADKLCESVTLQNNKQLRDTIAGYIKHKDQSDEPGYSPAALLHKMTAQYECSQVQDIADELQAKDEDLQHVEARIVLP